MMRSHGSRWKLESGVVNLSIFMKLVMLFYQSVYTEIKEMIGHGGKWDPMLNKQSSGLPMHQHKPPKQKK